MINLLPPEEKNKLLNEEKEKIVIILWILLLFFLLCCFLIILSINFYISGQLEYQNIISKNFNNNEEDKEMQNLRKNFIDFNDTILKIKDFYNQRIYFSQILEDISEMIPEDAYLTNVSVVLSSKEKVNSAQISLSGFISKRDSLLKFKEALEKRDDIKEVFFPPSNWTKPENINFSLTFRIIKK
jgi:Tfp pilus assembly protein PilN